MKVFITGAGALLGQGIIRALRRSTLKRDNNRGGSESALGRALLGGCRLSRAMARDPLYLDRLANSCVRNGPTSSFREPTWELPILAANREAIERTYGTKSDHQLAAGGVDCQRQMADLRVLSRTGPRICSVLSAGATKTR